MLRPTLAGVNVRRRGVAWTAPGWSYQEAIAADLDGDGRVEIASPGAAGLDVRSLDGVSLRQITATGRPLHFDCADMDGDGRADVVAENYTNGKNQMAVFSADGRQLARWTSPHVFDRFGVVRSLKAPWGNRLSRPRGMTMPVAGSDEGFLCLGTSKGSQHHHVTYVYGSGGDLVYADSADDDAEAVLALPRTPTGAGGQSFLVGGRNVIWKYTEKR